MTYTQAAVERAMRMGRVGPYQLQAAIAALHSEATTPERTDWKQIAALYQALAQMNGSPVVRLNHAVAVALGHGLEKGLKQIDQLGATGELDNYHLYHAARADLLRRMGYREQALQEYDKALALTGNAVERRYLRRRIAELGEESEKAGSLGG